MYLEDAARALEARAREVLETECRYACGRLEVLWTPRRLVLIASGMRPLAPLVEERVGPPKEAAYQDGRATAALEGFLRNVGASGKDVGIKSTPKGDRVVVRLRRRAKPLARAFEPLVRSLTFPKLMRWSGRAGGEMLFARPIRWTFAILGSKSLAYKIGAVASAPFTVGHRFLSKGRIRVTSSDPARYKAILRRHHVVLDPAERRAWIEKGLKRFGVRRPDPDLVAQTANLVEEPFLAGGAFQRRYLKLPTEVLTTCMKAYQKVFAVHAAEGSERIENKFVAVLNGPRAKASVSKIMRDYENVLESRLADAEFFYREDTRTKLSEKVGKLVSIVFLGKLGSLLDKTQRLVALAHFLGRQAGLPADITTHVARAAELCKADLVTHMVYEFPTLQGTMGKVYALASGEPAPVAEAIAFHYRPFSLSEVWAFSEKALQRFRVGALLGFVDRVDSLVGAFGAGLEPTGSEDPYALRRAGGGLAKIARAFELSCSLAEVLGKAYDLYETKMVLSRGQVIEKLAAFLKERVAFELAARPGTRAHEILSGVCSTRFDDLRDVFERYRMLSELAHRERTTFEQTCKVFERTANILKGSEGEVSDEIRPDLFRDPLESSLYERLQDAKTQVGALLAQREYGAATRAYGQVFYAPLAQFFDRVLVNVDDGALRKNRKALIKQIKDLYGRAVADLSTVTKLEVS